MPAISLKWDVTGRCNLHCKHCLVGSSLISGPDPELSPEKRTQLIDNLPEAAIRHVNIIGGEPTMLGEELIHLIEQCAGKGIKVTFNTNGMKLKRPLTERIVQAGAAGVIISIDGPTPESHDAVRGKGTFAIVTRNLAELVDYVRTEKIPFDITVNTVLTAANASLLGQMFDFCIAQGVDRLNILPLSYTGWAADNQDSLYLSEQEEIDAAEKLVRHISARPDGLGGLELEPRFILPPLADYLANKFGFRLPLTKNCCGATTTFGYIDPTGKLHACDRVAFEFADATFGARPAPRTSLSNTPFFDVWNSEFYTAMFKFISDRGVYANYVPCNRCEYLNAGFCVPCPLYALRNTRVSFPQCLFAERENGSLRLSESNRSARKRGSHYLNQYQPESKIVTSGDSSGEIWQRPVRLTQGLRWTMKENREVIFNPATNKFYTVTAQARLIWLAIDGVKTGSEICDSLESKGTNALEKVAMSQSVFEFLKALKSEGLVVCQ
jgi:MoaA/NifB/PqqE/SkfB family radical SAM enzyme